MTANQSIHIFHNLRWANYKGAIFSELHRKATDRGIDVQFCHVAETDSTRTQLSAVDMRFHSYPHKLAFEGAYDRVGKLRMVVRMAELVLTSRAKVVVLPGYSNVEHWAMLAAALVSKKTVAVFCDSTRRDRRQTLWKSWLKRFFFSRCSGVLAYGSRSADYVISHGVPSASVAFPCQAAAHIEARPAQERIEQRIQALPVQSRLLYVGRLAPEKGVADLISALSKLQDETAELTIVGHGPELNNLKQHAQDLGLDKRVHFVGPKSQDALHEEYRAATLLVLPSRSEPWGLVVNEALHFGCPVIASDACGCVPEMVVHGLTGFVFEPGDIDGMAAAIERGLKVLRTDSCARACVDLESTHTPSNAASTMLQKLEQLLLSQDD